MMRQFYFLPDKTGGFIKKLWLFACFLLFSWGANAQCPTGDVALYSQADVNNFATNYPNCTEITGYLYIGGSTITDLSPLSNIQSVGGYLEIYNTQLTNLDGLSNLTSIGADLAIYSNSALTDISGLQNIDSDSILSTYYGVGLYILNNPLLSVCNLDNFCTYLAGSGLRTISNNAGDCVSVTAVTTACTTSQEPQCPTGDVDLTSQTQVNDFGTNYPNCTEITGYLYISGSTITDLSPLSNIQSIGGYLNIFYNPQLTNLDGLGNLTQIGGVLAFQINAILENLDGLSALESINGDLIIYDNAVLTDISGLQNIDPATILPTNGFGLYIQNNPLLSVCNLDNFCTYLAGSGLRIISGNAGDCVSVTAVTTACEASQQPVCPTGDVILTSQAQVDAFGTNYPNCTEITGFLYIGGSNITDLSPLSNIQSVGGFLEIYNTQLTNLDGLSNLTQIGGYLYIVNNSQLTNLDGLSNLTSIGADLVIYSNSALTDISGLQNIDPNSILSSYFGVGLYIQNNPLLSVCNLDNFCTYLAGSGTRTISGNAGDCVSVTAVTTACTTSQEPQCPTGDVYLASQTQVNDFGTNYPNCTEILGNLSIQGNSTDLSPLNNIQSVGGYLEIYNTQLTNLDGLSNLTEIGGYLLIESNSQLTNLDGLSALESINGDLVIYNNAVLTDISGLQNIDPATILSTNGLGLYIQYNSLLSVCNLDNFCTYLAGSGLRTISNNAGDCVSVTAVTTACTTSQEPQCPTGDVILTSQTQVNDFGTNYPNCTEITGYLYISGSDITGLSPLSNIIAVTGNLYAEHSSQLTSLQGLHNVASVGGGLSIYNNPQLNSVQALSNITSLGGFLSIYNTNLSSLEGLHNITAIDGGLSITSNAVLTDISALENIDPETITDTGLYIAGNSSLSVCDLDNFCTFLQGSGTRTISGNAGNCYESAVTNACLSIISYCTPIPDSTSVSYGIYINSFTVTGGETNIINTSSGFSANAYGNFSDNHSASQMAGESLSFSAVPGNESFQKGLRIWVDWNNDGVFDNTASNSEIVYVSPNVLYGTHNGSFTIPSDKPAGNYRMRVMMKYESTTIDPCEITYGAPYNSYFYGETEDYTLTVVADLSGNCESYTIWNGTQWSNGTPDANKKAIIEGNLTLTGNMTACELKLNSGIVTVNSGATLTVNGVIENTQSEANFIVENGGNLIQTDDVENIGEITVVKSKTMKHLDYTIWSSPVLGQNLKAFSPLTLNNRIRIYDTTDDSWKVIANPETTDFVSGAGVMFRAPNADDNPGTPYLWTGSFKGIPQNGNVTYNFNNAYGNGIYQSVGNPYPSNIDSEVFFDFNPEAGTLYFWTNTNAYDGNDYIGYNWATINSAGDAVEAGNGAVVPNGIIPSGQGFVVETNGIIEEVSFNNQMRTSNSGIFFRTMTDEKHRIWLDLSQENQSINQMLVGYSDNATNEFDFGIDSKLFNYSGSALYSLINNNDESYVIQNRSLPFDDNDIVPLGFRATQAGSFTVSLSNFDGLFAENQDIFIKDNFTNATHNLKNGSYTFVSENGTFDNRFELVYRESSMSVSNPDLNNNWIVYKQNDVFHIQTQGFDMKEITVYDMLGRTVYTSKADGNTHAFSKIGADQVLIVKVTTSENEVMNKKVTN